MSGLQQGCTDISNPMRPRQAQSSHAMMFRFGRHRGVRGRSH